MDNPFAREDKCFTSKNGNPRLVQEELELVAEHEVDRGLRMRKLCILGRRAPEQFLLWKPMTAHLLNRTGDSSCGDYHIQTSPVEGWLLVGPAALQINAGTLREDFGLDQGIPRALSASSLHPMDLAPSILGKYSCSETVTETIPMRPVAGEVIRPASHRRFASEPLELNRIEKFLADLLGTGGRPAYPATGGIYDYQLVVIAFNVSGLRRGAWIVGGGEFNLLSVSEAGIHYLQHTSIAYLQNDGSSPSALILVVSNLKALRLKYGRFADDYGLLTCGALISAAYMCAALSEIGICGIGRLDAEAIGDAIKLDEQYVLGAFCLGVKE